MADYQTTQKHPRESFRFHWGAVFAGTVAALGIWLLLYMLGWAIGFSSIEPTQLSSLGSLGWVAGWWTFLSPLIALGFGAWIGARAAGPMNRQGGALHGVVIWGLSSVASFFLITWLATSLMGGAVQMTSSAIGATGSMMGSAVQQVGKMAQGADISVEAVIEDVNQRLEERQLPKLEDENIKQAFNALVSDVMQQGEVNREMVVEALSQNTKLSEQQINEASQEVTAMVSQQWQQVRGQASQLGQTVQEETLQALQSLSKVFWTFFAGLLIGMIAAAVGGSMGVSNRQKEDLEGQSWTGVPDRTAAQRPVYEAGAEERR